MCVPRRERERERESQRKREREKKRERERDRETERERRAVKLIGLSSNCEDRRQTQSDPPSIHSLALLNLIQCPYLTNSIENIHGLIFFFIKKPTLFTSLQPSPEKKTRIIY